MALPLVLPPTVLCFYLLITLGGRSPIGQFYDALLVRSLVFSFDGLLVPWSFFRLPFAVFPIRRRSSELRLGRGTLLRRGGRKAPRRGSPPQLPPGHILTDCLLAPFRVGPAQAMQALPHWGPFGNESVEESPNTRPRTVGDPHTTTPPDRKSTRLNPRHALIP